MFVPVNMLTLVFCFVATTMYEISRNPWLSLAGNMDIQPSIIEIVLLEMG